MSKKHIELKYQKNEAITELAIDSHAHLDRLESASEIISNMSADGLKKIVIMAGDIKTAKWAAEQAKAHKNIYYMFGLHPYDTQEFTDEYIKVLKDLARTDKKMVGVGEIGLDYKPSEWIRPREEQIDVFIGQLKIANELSLPVSIHIREAHADAMEILTQNRELIKNGGIIHCCSATKEEVETYLSLGFYISFSGSITYGKKNAEYYLEETLKAVPLDRLLIETDCPFLCPAPYRGQTNEPKFVLVTAERMAEVLNMDANTLIKITTQNAERLLKIK